MATALRVMHPAVPDNRRATVTVAALSHGPFAAQVIELLQVQPAVTVARFADPASAFASDADLVMVALWRADPDLCEQADLLAHRMRRPWFPVVAEHPVIRVGPYVQPGHGPCYDCYLRRRIQHDIHHVTTRALHAAYAADPTCGPAGFLPHHARLAAGVAVRMATAVRTPSAVPGEVVTIRLLRAALSSDPVVSCHDCERCRQPQPTRELTDLLRLTTWGEASSDAVR